jgi:hypothetical protein
MSVSVWTGQSSVDDLNFSNVNFRALMQLLGEPVDSEYGMIGRLERPDIVRVMGKAQAVLATLRRLYTAKQLALPDAPCVIHTGVQDPRYLAGRLSDLLAVCGDAIQLNQPIHFG